MTHPEDATVDAVIVPEEQVHPDRHEHGKTGKHVDDEELAARTEHEREEIADR